MRSIMTASRMSTPRWARAGSAMGARSLRAAAAARHCRAVPRRCLCAGDSRTAQEDDAVSSRVLFQSSMCVLTLICTYMRSPFSSRSLHDRCVCVLLQAVACAGSDCVRRGRYGRNGGGGGFRGEPHRSVPGGISNAFPWWVCDVRLRSTGAASFAAVDTHAAGHVGSRIWT
jgi:hypothetical protein